VDLEHAILEGRVDLVDIHPWGQRDAASEGAGPSLAAVVVVFPGLRSGGLAGVVEVAEIPG
jgi:hypothetical protein